MKKSPLETFSRRNCWSTISLFVIIVLCKPISKSQYRGIAQLVEHRSPKPSAEGSIPSAPAKITDTTFVVFVIFLFVQTIEPKAREECRGEAVRRCRWQMKAFR